MAVEIVAGVAFGSMALLADGLHMGSYAVALGLSAYAYARRRAADPRFAFGTGKVNVLAGYTGAVLLTGFALVMAWESLARLLAPVPIAFDAAIGVAVLGLLVNGALVLILDDHGHGHDHHHEAEHGHHHHGGADHNLRSAYLHVLADALTSILAIVALLAGKYLGATWLDPLMGIVGAALVARWAWYLLAATGGILLDRQAPERVREAVRGDRGQGRRPPRRPTCLGNRPGPVRGGAQHCEPRAARAGALQGAAPARARRRARHRRGARVPGAAAGAAHLGGASRAGGGVTRPLRAPPKSVLGGVWLRRPASAADQVLVLNQSEVELGGRSFQRDRARRERADGHGADPAPHRRRQPARGVTLLPRRRARQPHGRGR